MDVPRGTIIIWGSSNPIPSGWEKINSSYEGGLLFGYNQDTIQYSTPSIVSGISHTHSCNNTSSSSNFQHKHADSSAIEVGSSGGIVASTGTPTTIAHESHSHNFYISYDEYNSPHTHSFSNISVGNASVSDITPLHKTVILIMKQ